jgi:hypothetical protein
MNLQGLKSVCPLGPVSLTAAGTATSANIDCKGYEELQLVVTKTTHASDYITVLNIQQSDSTDATNFAAVTGYVAGTDWTLASLTGGTNAATEKAAGVFNIDLRGKKRYFRVLVTNGAVTGVVGITGTLARAEQAPITATNQHAGVVVNPS